MTRSRKRPIATAALGMALAMIATLAGAQGFSSGSTGADGAFSPTCTPTPCTVTHPLPPSGIFHFTTVTVPAGVTVKFARNATNTPVVMLATGDVSIAGTIDVGGGDSLDAGNLPGDRTLPGLGGPGGFNGGRGGRNEVDIRGGNGLGPGAGGGGSAPPQGGGGAGYGAAGGNNVLGTQAGNTGLGGGTYGSNLLLPLVGGSGGGGGAGSSRTDGFTGTAGGGGGGAILIASSRTVNLTGAVLARGGNPGSPNVNSFDPLAHGSRGGGGSGGAIRVVASSVIGSGTLNVDGGNLGSLQGFQQNISGRGGRGRTSVEVVNAGTLNVSNAPALAITSVAGIAAPATPTGVGDVIVPESTPNPATVLLATTGVPVGGTVKVTLTPLRNASTSVTSTPLAGTTASATASASIDIPLGQSTLTASTSFTVSLAQGEALSQFARNERVESVTLVATFGGAQMAKLITVSGKEYEVPAEVLRVAGLGG